jgi:hypothetical protein
VENLKPRQKYIFQIVVAFLLIILVVSILKGKLFSSITNIGKSPYWIATWGAPYSGSNGCKALDISIDNDGNIYLLGSYSNLVDFDPGTGTANVGCLPNSPHISKLDSTGNFQWTMGWGSLEIIWDRVYRICAIPGGGVVLVGTFKGDIDFNPGDWSNTEQPDIEKVYIIAFRANGEKRWVRTWEVEPQPRSLMPVCNVAADESGNVYVVGNFQGQCDFGDETGTLCTSQPQGGYLVKFRPDGNLEWVQIIAGSDDDRVFSLALDQNGYVYLGGRLLVSHYHDSNVLSNMTFDLGEIRGFSQEIYYYSFFTKFDTNGSPLWTNLWKAGGMGNGVLSIDLDKSGKIYTLSNAFSSDPDMDPGPGVQHGPVHDYNRSSSALSRFTPDGEFELVSWWGGLELLTQHTVKILADESGNAYILSDLNNFLGIESVSCGRDRIGILNRYGEQTEVLQLEDCKCSSMALDPEGRLLILGTRGYLGYMSDQCGSRIIQLPQELSDIVLIRVTD